MKKTYKKPVVQKSEAEVQNLMAVSLLNGSANPNAEVLTKEDSSWDIWSDSEE